MQEKFDAIIVGAGLAGCATAYTLAKSGLQVLVVERGKFPGAKNMIGGMIYGEAINELIPNFWEQAPIERYINRQTVTLLSDKSFLSFDFQTESFAKPPYNSFSALRARFDKWLGQKVEEAGAIVVPGLRADDLVWDGKRIVGVKAGGDALTTDVVIAADGVNSLLAQKAGLRGELSPEHVSQGVKEIIKLPRETIEERFNLSGDEGVANTFLGFCTRGVHGGGFIYTNKESISLGVVAQLSALLANKLKASDLIESFKEHPAVRNLIKDGTVAEYSAHLIPAAGKQMMPRSLYTDGFLITGDAAALVLTTGLHLEGANFAIASGIAAAKTVLKAREKMDFSSASLSYYEQLLRESFVLKDLNTFVNAPLFLDNPRIYATYPAFVCDLMERMLTVDGKPKKKTMQIAREAMKGKVSMWQLLRDGCQGGRAI